MSHPRRVRRGLLALVSMLGSAVALVLVGVGAAPAQTTTTAPGSTAPASAAAVRGVTDTSITVGGVGHALLYGGADVGARARFQRANDAGGVHGRTIEYLGLSDDDGDPAAGSAAANNLVQQGAFAVVPAVTPDFAASAALVEQKVPYFGWALSSSFCGNRYGFGFSGCPVPDGATSNVWPLLVRKALPPGAQARRVAIATENTPSGQYELRALTAAAKSVKFKVVYAKASLGSPVTADENAVAQEIVTSNSGTIPDAVFVVGNPSNVLGMQQALGANGFLGFFTNRIQYAPNFVAPAINAFVLTQTAPVESASTNPAMQQLIADVQRIAPQQPIDPAVVAGYWSADLFLAAVERAGRQLTPAALVKAANTKFEYVVPDTVGPTSFPSGHAVPTPCGALVTSNGTAFSVKVPYTCGRVIQVE
jgi:ABC-type branched-subunit amino acid transport system substrate-binding protein